MGLWKTLGGLGPLFGSPEAYVAGELADGRRDDDRAGGCADSPGASGDVGQNSVSAKRGKYRYSRA